MKNSSIKVLVADVVRFDRKTTLQVEILNIENIKKVVWTKFSNLDTTSTPNTSMNVETNVILVTSVYTEEGQIPNITYWIAEDYKMTKDYGLVINKFLPDDQGVYCCKILSFNNDLYEHCVTVTVTGKCFCFCSCFCFLSFVLYFVWFCCCCCFVLFCF